MIHPTPRATIRFAYRRMTFKSWVSVATALGWLVIASVGGLAWHQISNLVEPGWPMTLVMLAACPAAMLCAIGMAWVARASVAARYPLERLTQEFVLDQLEPDEFYAFLRRRSLAAPSPFISPSIRHLGLLSSAALEQVAAELVRRSPTDLDFDSKGQFYRKILTQDRNHPSDLGEKGRQAQRLFKQRYKEAPVPCPT